MTEMEKKEQAEEDGRAEEELSGWQWATNKEKIKQYVSLPAGGVCLVNVIALPGILHFRAGININVFRVNEMISTFFIFFQMDVVRLSEFPSFFYFACSRKNDNI